VEIKSVGKKKTNTRILYWFGNNPCLHHVPKQPAVLEISFNLIKPLQAKIHKGCTLPCSLWKTKWMYPLLFSVTTTQVDVPSTCTTKDIPSNVLRQRILRRLVLWNLLFKGKGRIKRILRLSPFEFSWKGRRETQKNSGG